MDVLTAVLASNVYRTSANKARIYAAIVDPTNKELVEQLSSYLDEPEPKARVRKDLIEKPEVEEVEERPEAEPRAQESPQLHTTPTVHHPSSTQPQTSSPEPEVSEHTQEAPSQSTETHQESHEEAQEETEDNDAQPAQETPEDNEVETSSDVSKRKVKSSSSVEASTKWMSKLDYVSSNLDGIRGLLNAKDDTAGVSRVAMKENELWCYYQDSINLNDIMVSVVDLLASSGYCSCLEFNRLARSDNAIVFEVDNKSSIELSSISELEEKGE